MRLENFLYDFKDSDFLYLGTALAQPGKGLYPMAAHGSPWQPRCASSQDGEFRGWQMSRRTTDGSNSPIVWDINTRTIVPNGILASPDAGKIVCFMLVSWCFFGVISPFLGALTSKETH